MNLEENPEIASSLRSSQRQNPSLPDSRPAGQKRKRGGQPGNHNSLKHGIYSKFMLLADENTLEGMTDGSMKDELALARTRLKNALELTQMATDKTEKLGWDAACHYWFESIVKIKASAVEKGQQSNDIWDSFIEAIRAANDRQGVK